MMFFAHYEALNFERYKFIVQVYIGERREQGVRVGSKCFWDSNTDNQASEIFTNVIRHADQRLCKSTVTFAAPSLLIN